MSVNRDGILKCFQSDEAKTYAGIALDATMRGSHRFAAPFWVSAYNIEKAHREGGCDQHKVEG
jgi:hypothetical protein